MPGAVQPLLNKCSASGARTFPPARPPIVENQRSPALTGCPATFCPYLPRPFARQPFCRFSPKPFSVAPAVLSARQHKGTPLSSCHRCTTRHPALQAPPRTTISPCGAPGTGHWARGRVCRRAAPSKHRLQRYLNGGTLCRRLFCGALPGRAGQSFPSGTGAMLKTFWARLFLPRFLQPRPAGTICLCWGNNQPHPNIGGQVPCKAADMVLV